MFQILPAVLFVTPLLAGVWRLVGWFAPAVGFLLLTDLLAHPTPFRLLAAVALACAVLSIVRSFGLLLLTAARRAPALTRRAFAAAGRRSSSLPRLAAR